MKCPKCGGELELDLVLIAGEEKLPEEPLPPAPELPPDLKKKLKKAKKERKKKEKAKECAFTWDSGVRCANKAIKGEIFCKDHINQNGDREGTV